jgi:hypothetical protein
MSDRKSSGSRVARWLHEVALVTRYDRTWEPLAVVFAAAVLWLGTFV